MFGKSIRISGNLYNSIERVIAHTGHANVSKFAQEVLEREVAKRLEEIQIENQLKGLGYIE